MNPTVYAERCSCGVYGPTPEPAKRKVISSPPPKKSVQIPSRFSWFSLLLYQSGPSRIHEAIYRLVTGGMSRLRLLPGDVLFWVVPLAHVQRKTLSGPMGAPKSLTIGAE